MTPTQSAKMSAEWWEAEARRYCELHIAAHQRLVAAEAHDRELLWQAFLAGFEESCEGFNGEYVGESYRGRDGVHAPAFVERMRPEFERWLAENLK